MKVKWLRTALLNLDQEAAHIAEENPAAAQMIVRRIIESVNLLADNPSMGHPGRVHGTRELIIPGTSYIVPYRVRPRLDQVEILRVFHSSRKPPKRW